jgi:hypothetical protein
MTARRHGGDPLGGRRNGEALAYYWAHVDLDQAGCIIWPYGKANGYGAAPTRPASVTVTRR